MQFLKAVLVVLMLSVLVWVIDRERSAAGPSRFRAETQSSDAAAKGYRVDWGLLRLLDLRSGEVPDRLRSYDGKYVALPGFVVPLEDNAGVTGEFLVVPYFGACIHTPPPPANQMVFVKMSGARQIHPPFEAVWVHGLLQISGRHSPYGSVSFQMTGSHIEPYRE